jgi:hypothetical protein
MTSVRPWCNLPVLLLSTVNLPYFSTAVSNGGAQTQTASHPLPNATDERVSKAVKLCFGAVQ